MAPFGENNTIHCQLRNLFIPRDCTHALKWKLVSKPSFFHFIMAETDTKISAKRALDLYKSTLNFNVISRYDPNIKQLLYTTSHCVIYKFDESQEWEKTDYQGTLALYLRDFTPPAPGEQLGLDQLQRLFCYGLILLNRQSPECFSLGLLPNKVTKHFFPTGVQNNGNVEMDVEMNDNLIIVKDLIGDIYGLWIFNESDRKKLYQLMEFCLKNDVLITAPGPSK